MDNMPREEVGKAKRSWLYSPFLLAPLLLIIEGVFVVGIKLLLPAQYYSNVLIRILIGILFWVSLYVAAKRFAFFSGPSVNLIAYFIFLVFVAIIAGLILEFYQFSFLAAFYVLFFSMYPVYFLIGRIQAELKVKAQLDESNHIAGGN
jgi:hypothetical protein